MAAKKTAENLIKQYGRDQFVKLLEAFRNNESGSEIASKFGVSRQRVNQWRHELGQDRVLYLVHPDVQALLELPASRTIV